MTVALPSKPLRKVDTAGKQLIIDLLDGAPTHGFDIDSIYKSPQGWVVIELLKCDAVPPTESHPNRYWYNHRKFESLWAVAQKLEGQLILVNYQVPYSEFKVMLVRDVIPGPEGWIVTESHCCGLDAVRRWYLRLNASAVAE